MRWSAVGGLLALVSLSACHAPMPSAAPLRTSHVMARHAFLETGAAGNREEFRHLCRLQGVELDGNTLEAIARATTILPNGQWQGDLTSAWQRDGLPAIDSPDAFHEAALRFARERNATVGFYFDLAAYRATGRISVVHWEPNRGQYLVLGTDGAIQEYRPYAPAPSQQLVRIPADLFPGAL